MKYLDKTFCTMSILQWHCLRMNRGKSAKISCSSREKRRNEKWEVKTCEKFV